MSEHTPLLCLKQLHVAYGHVQAVTGIDLEIHHGEMVCLVGANGAGKTTTLQSISGIQKNASGHILWNGTDISHLPPHRRVALGLVQVPEGRAILNTLTVQDNLVLGGYTQPDKPDLESIYHRFPILRERRSQLAGNLSGGEQQMLALGRALLAKPRLLMLDEPSMGLAPQITLQIFSILRELHQEGLTIFLVEQNVRQALKLADRGYVMETGKITLSGQAKELSNDSRIISAYLGG